LSAREMGIMTPPEVTDLLREVDGGVSEKDCRGDCGGSTSHDQDSAVIMTMNIAFYYTPFECLRLVENLGRDTETPKVTRE